MSSYRFWTTNLLTGAVTADNIPLQVQSFGRQIGAVGQLTGSLTLSTNDTQNAAYLGALEPRRSVLWVSQDGAPIWSGIVWDWTHSSILDGTLPIAASTIESIFARRQIDVTLNYSATDVFDIFRALLSFATSKVPNGQVAGLSVPSNKAGSVLNASYQAADKTKIWDAWTSLQPTGGFEFTFVPAMDASGNGTNILQLGYPRIGAPLGSSNLVFRYPGNVLDYGFPRTGSSASNSIIATAPPNGSAASWQSIYPHGQDTFDLNAGYPLLEDSVSYAGIGVATQAQVDGYVDRLLPSRTGAQETPTVTLGPGLLPLVRQISLGDYAWLLATSPLHPARSDGSPGLQVAARIIGWTVTPPSGTTAESTKITFAGIPQP